MNTFETIDELWIDAAQQIIEHGSDIPSRDGDCREIMGYVSRLENPLANFMFNPHRALSPAYAAAELIWYLSGERNIDRIKAYAPQYARFGNDGIAHGAYGFRLAETSSEGLTMLAHIIRILVKNPNSRQTVLGIWSNSMDLEWADKGGKNDLPCTLSLNFLARGGKLNLCVTMRSNDIWLGLPYDIFCFTSLQYLIAKAARLEVGWYQHQAMSLHVYDRNREKFMEAANPCAFDVGPLGPYNGEGLVSDAVKELVQLEEWNRKHTVCTERHSLHPGSKTEELMFMAATKWAGERAASRIHNPLLRKFACS